MPQRTPRSRYGGPARHPSEDTFHDERPELDVWKLDQQVKKIRAPQAAKIQSLATELHEDPEKLAKRIPADTLRRLKFPMIEERNADGTTSFKQDKGIVEGQRSLVATDRREA